MRPAPCPPFGYTHPRQKAGTATAVGTASSDSPRVPYNSFTAKLLGYERDTPNTLVICLLDNNNKRTKKRKEKQQQ